MRDVGSRRISVVAVVAAACGFAGAAWMKRADAEGIPSGQTLYYAGTLLEAGQPTTGIKKIGVSAWSADIDGSKACETPEADTPVQQGRFRILLNDMCLNAVRMNPNLWLQASVGGVVLGGRKKVGAVAYAVESERAQSATRAAGALEKRLADLEARVNTLEGKVTGKLAKLAFATPLDACAQVTSTTWVDVPGVSVMITVDKPVSLLATYSINVQPVVASAGQYVATRLVVNGMPSEGSGSHYQPFASNDTNVNLSGLHAEDTVPAGAYTITMQWRTSLATVPWNNCPRDWGDTLGGRSMVVQAFYK